jgi:hypothetical protein
MGTANIIRTLYRQVKAIQKAEFYLFVIKLQKTVDPITNRRRMRRLLRENDVKSHFLRRAKLLFLNSFLEFRF